MFLIASFILITTIFAWIQIATTQKKKRFSSFPSRKKIFLLGNSLDFIGKSSNKLLDTLQDMKKELGPVYHYSLSSFDDGHVVVTDPKCVEVFLSNQKYIDKSSDYDMFKNWQGENLFMVSGQKWYQSKKFFAPTFHFQALEKFVEISDEQSKILLDQLEKTNGSEVNVVPFMHLFALDVICEYAMGIKLNAQIGDPSSKDYVKAIDRVTKITFGRIFNIFHKNDFLYRFTSTYTEEKKVVKVVNNLPAIIIKRGRKNLETRKDSVTNSEDCEIKKYLSFLDSLLLASVDGKPLTDGNIIHHIAGLVFAGHDTSSIAISFCLFNVAKHPEVQAKIRDEIKTFNTDDPVTIKDLNNLHYLENVINETLRLYPSAPVFFRKLPEDVTIDGYTFPKDCKIIFSPYLMGRDENIFPDPLKFNPDRFDAEITGEKINRYAFISFSAGPRNCLGKKFAMLEMKLTIAKIIQNYDVKISHNLEDLDLYLEMVLKPHNGIKLSFCKIGS